MSPTVRRAAESDIPALMRLYTEFHNFHAEGVPAYLAVLPEADDPSLAEAIRGILANPKAVLLVACEDANVVGLAEAYLKETDPSPAVVQKRYVLLQSLAVTSRCRRHGVGLKLMEAVHEWAGAQGAAELRTDVWEFPAGPRRFYERLGYTTIKRTLARPLV